MKWLHKSARAFTLVEVLIVLGVVILLAALLLPVFMRVRNGARSTACMSNLHQIGLALQLYSENNGGRYPAYEGEPTNCTWVDATIPFTKTSEVFVCPSGPNGIYEPGCGIGRDMNGTTNFLNGGYALDVPELTTSISTLRVRVPSQFVLVVDASSSPSQLIAVGATAPAKLSPDDMRDLSITFRHNDRTNALFADDHSKSLSADDASDSALWKLSGHS